MRGGGGRLFPTNLYSTLYICTFTVLILSSGPVHFTFDDHAYFYSGSEEVHKDDKVREEVVANHLPS